MRTDYARGPIVTCATKPKKPSEPLLWTTRDLILGAVVSTAVAVFLCLFVYVKWG